MFKTIAMADLGDLIGSPDTSGERIVYPLLKNH